MDIKNFYSIGIGDVFWRYDPFEYEWKKVFIQIYIPNTEGKKYGEQYCIKYSFLDNNNVVTEETFESTKLDFSFVEKEDNLYEVIILSEKHILNYDQIKKLINILNKKKNLNFRL